MPEVMQNEVLECLSLLEIKPDKTAQSFNIKSIKEQYLRLAQMYHPDVVAQIKEEEMKEGESLMVLEEKFIQVKEAFDRLVELNGQYGGQLLIDPETERAEELEKQARRAQMHELRMKMAKARVGQQHEDKLRLEQLEVKLNEEERIRELRRQAVVAKQIAELDALRKYEIKMLVRMDKEYSDITYVPTSSLGSMIDNLCKRHANIKFGEEEAKHNRPYYDYEEQVKLFDQSSISRKMEEIQNNPELQKRLQAEREASLQKERSAQDERKRQLEQAQARESQDRM